MECCLMMSAVFVWPARSSLAASSVLLLIRLLTGRHTVPWPPFLLPYTGWTYHWGCQGQVCGSRGMCIFIFKPIITFECIFFNFKCKEILFSCLFPLYCLCLYYKPVLYATASSPAGQLIFNVKADYVLFFCQRWHYVFCILNKRNRESWHTWVEVLAIVASGPFPSVQSNGTLIKNPSVNYQVISFISKGGWRVAVNFGIQIKCGLWEKTMALYLLLYLIN